MLNDIFTKSGSGISFEVFPPKKDDEFESAYSVLNELATLNPDFISCTYGAGGSRSKKTLDIVSYIQNTLHIDSIAHITCVGFTEEALVGAIQEYEKAGVKNILALRGDRPQSMTDEQYHNREYFYASQMIKHLKEITTMTIAAACYPEKHFEAASFEEDLLHLKEKVDLGAQLLISQLFFDNRKFYQFLEETYKRDIRVPILAGIMPVTTAKQLGTTVTLSGSSIPKELSDIIATYGDSPADMRKAGIDYAIRQIIDLQENGVDGIHLYSMNKPKTTAEIVHAIRS